MIPRTILLVALVLGTSIPSGAVQPRESNEPRLQALQVAGDHDGLRRITERLFRAFENGRLPTAPYPRGGPSCGLCGLGERTRATRALYTHFITAAQKDPERGAAILRVLLTQERLDPYVRGLGLKKLAHLDPEKSGPFIAGFLESLDARSRRAAAEALGRTGDPSILPRLALLLEDEKQVVRRAAALSMGKLAGNPWEQERDPVAAARRWWAER